MNGWREVNLGEVADLCLGKMLDAKKNRGEPYPYLSNPDVRWFDVDTTRLKNMLFESRELDRFGLRAGDVLVCEGGEAGRAAVWDGRRPDVKFQKAIHRVRPGPHLFNRFLVHKLFADYHAGRLEDYYTGATIKHLTGQDLATYEISLPPVDEQRRIAEVLDQAEALRAKRRAALALLDTLAQSIFLDLFGDPVTNPRGWTLERLDTLIAEFRYGTSEKSGPDGVPTLRIPNVVRGAIDLSDLKTVPVSPAELQRLQLVPGDVLFVRTNGNAEFVGRCAVFDEGVQTTAGGAKAEFIFASYLIRARPRQERMDSVYLREFMLGPQGRRQLLSRSKTSAGQFNINTENLGAILVPVPPLSLQRSFVARMAALESLKAPHRASLAQLDALFASLQHRAFRGEL